MHVRFLSGFAISGSAISNQKKAHPAEKRRHPQWRAYSQGDANEDPVAE
jgi:hypothetical protein